MASVAAAGRASKCSVVARSIDAPAIATAGSYERVLLVERPLPWPADVADDPHLAPLVDHARRGVFGPGATRVQAVVRDQADSCEVTLYRRPPGHFDRFRRSTSVGEPATLVERALELANGSLESATTPDASEILVCTHGRRDACCGSLGPGVFADLSERFASRPDVRVRKTSHLGGHRFAPTVLLLPTGTLWAWVDHGLMASIVEQTAPVEQSASHYRGCMGLDAPEIQAADGALFERYGWEWLIRARAGQIVDRSDAETRVRFEYTEHGRDMTLDATVRCIGHAPIPVCRVALDGTEKVQDRFEVVAVADPIVT